MVGTIPALPLLNTMPKHILAIFGTRPEAIKMGPVVTALRADGAFRLSTLATAQHREMLDEVLGIFDIEPDFDLNVMTENQRLVDVTVKCLTGIHDVLARETPDLVLAQGDTTTVLAAALACYYHRIPLGHVEAGLRTADKYAPYPEELNRRVTGVMADLHFAPTNGARDNLLREGVPPETIHVTGNTVVDAVLAIGAAPPPRDAVLETVDRFRKSVKRLILVTTHRRESFGAPLRETCRALLDILERHPDTGIVLPVHPNPNVSTVVREFLEGQERALLIAPVDYLRFVHLIRASDIVLTDSGGIQEEAPSLGKPVLVLRTKTERPEGIAAGVARLVGTDRDRIVAETDRLLDDEAAYRDMVGTANPYGDGKAAGRIVEAIRSFFGD